MQPTTIASTTTAPAKIDPQFGVDVFSVIGDKLGDSEGTAHLFTGGGFFDLLNTIWFVYAILAYLVCILFLVMYVYASVRKKLYSDLQTEAIREGERLYDEKYRGAARNTRLKDVLTHIDSENPNDWKLAIIEADIILDDILKKRGYVGNSLGERLKSISVDQLASLNDAWEAHKVRNRIAHDGADFVLTKRIAQETVVRYQKVFKEFDVN